MQWVPSDENKRRDEAFADFIGGVAYEEDRGWSKEVWNAAWSARRVWVGLTEEERQHFRGLGFVGVEQVEAKLREKNGC
jgi:hypothetical protein